MKIVIAPDSFKDSLNSQGVAQAIAQGVQDVLPDSHVVLCPMADGGEGTVEAILAAVPGERRSESVRGPLGAPVTARWGWFAQTRLAIVEMAEASGLQLLALDQRDACRSSSRGTGELMVAALDAGAQQIILTIGGSATNDGGSGMLTALGARFLDGEGNELQAGGLALATLDRIDLSGLDPRLQSVQVVVAADVDNPLCGPKGASFTFGGQKGANPEQLQALDFALAHFADCCAQVLGKDVRHVPGTGAAGGMGFAAKAFLQAEFRPGVEVVAELVGLAGQVSGADLLITGEGRCDAQTLHGKAPIGVARIASAHGVPVVILAGTLGEGYQAVYNEGVTAAFSIVAGPTSLAQACEQAPALLRSRTNDLMRLWMLGREGL